MVAKRHKITNVPLFKKLWDIIFFNLKGTVLLEEIKGHKIIYVLLLYIIYVMQSGRFSQSPAFLSRTAKEWDEKYSVKSQIDFFDPSKCPLEWLIK